MVRAQLYVDDPAVCARGSPEGVEEAFDILLLWWLVLGLPLAWKKGSVHMNEQPYDWIGVHFIPTAQGEVHMELPKQFLRDFLEALRPFCRTKGIQF